MGKQNANQRPAWVRLLSSQAWIGIGVIVALIFGILQLEIVKGTIRDILPIETQTEKLVEETFSVHKRVRCPGGGDLFGREKNKRDDTVRFRVPQGQFWIEGDAKVEVLGENYGWHGDVEYIEENILGKRRRVEVRVPISCNPPDYPGAPGGWMDIRVIGKFTQRRVDGSITASRPSQTPACTIDALGSS